MYSAMFVLAIFVAVYFFAFGQASGQKSPHSGGENEKKGWLKFMAILLLAFSVVGSLGGIFGDIGTSPNYAVDETMKTLADDLPNHLQNESKLTEATKKEKEDFFEEEFQSSRLRTESVLGVISLEIWLLIFMTIMYPVVMMQLDYLGQGGTYAWLGALNSVAHKIGPSKLKWMTRLCILSASLMVDDGVFTPAISVRSSFDVLEVIEARFPDLPHLSGYALMLSIITMVGIFYAVSRGIGRVTFICGLWMIVFFVALLSLGLLWIPSHPEVLGAFNPAYAVNVVLANPSKAVRILGHAVLVVTGMEALVADMGHYGRKAVRIAWGFVFVCLITHYLGQGAFLLSDAPIIGNLVLFSMIPEKYLIAFGVLDWGACVIASFALILGLFSQFQQGMGRYFPYLKSVPTSQHHEGQIYIPLVNKTLCFACLIVLATFQTTTAMASAYGMSVTGAMTVTSVVLFFVAYYYKEWSFWVSLALSSFFFVFCGTFFVANLSKFKERGWVPVVIATCFMVVVNVWMSFRAQIAKALGDFIKDTCQDLLFVKKAVHLNDGKRGMRTHFFLVSQNYAKEGWLDMKLPVTLMLLLQKQPTMILDTIILLFVEKLHENQVDESKENTKRCVVCDQYAKDGLISITVRQGRMETDFNLQTHLVSLHAQGVFSTPKGDWMMPYGYDRIRLDEGLGFLRKTATKIFLTENMMSLPFPETVFPSDGTSFQEMTWPIPVDLVVRPVGIEVVCPPVTLKQLFFEKKVTG